MRLIFSTLLLFTSLFATNAQAMTDQQLGECVMAEQFGRTQMLLGYLQQMAKENSLTEIESQSMREKIVAPEVQTCRQLDAILAQTLADTLKKTP